jgi:hypothetical protein
MADHPAVVRHIDAADPQRPARRDAVRILADANSQVETRGGVSF